MCKKNVTLMVKNSKDNLLPKTIHFEKRRWKDLTGKDDICPRKYGVSVEMPKWLRF